MAQPWTQTLGQQTPVALHMFLLMLTSMHHHRMSVPLVAQWAGVQRLRAGLPGGIPVQAFIAPATVGMSHICPGLSYRVSKPNVIILSCAVLCCLLQPQCTIQPSSTTRPVLVEPLRCHAMVLCHWRAVASPRTRLSTLPLTFSEGKTRFQRGKQGPCGCQGTLAVSSRLSFCARVASADKPVALQHMPDQTMLTLR